MKRLLLLAAFVSASISGHVGTAHAGHQSAKLFPVTIRDDEGNRVRIAHQPKRIVSLFADYTEILFSLGLEKRVVGDGSQYAEVATGIVNAAGKPRDFRYPSEWPSRLGRDYPVKAPNLPHVDGGFGGTQFNLETIESLRPDLIFAPYYKSQVPTYGKLQDLGLTVVFLNPATVQNVFHDITLVGRATGAMRQARMVTREMTSQLHGLQHRLVHVTSRPRVFYEVDATNPTQPYTAGPGTVPDQAIHLARGRNLGDAITSCSGTQCYPAISSEEILAFNPQIIVLADAAYGVTVDNVRARAGYDGLAAVKSGRIDPINPDLLSKFGPRIVIGVATLAKLIHPQAFRS